MREGEMFNARGRPHPLLWIAAVVSLAFVFAIVVRSERPREVNAQFVPIPPVESRAR